MNAIPLSTTFDKKHSTLFKQAIADGKPGSTRGSISEENLYLRDIEQIRNCLSEEQKDDFVSRMKQSIFDNVADDKDVFLSVYKDIVLSLETDFTSEQANRIVNTLRKFKSRFIVPIEQLGDSLDYLLDESQGPTDAFKDLALQMLTEMVAIIVEEYNTEQVDIAKNLKDEHRGDFDNWKLLNTEKFIGDYYDEQHIPRPNLKFIITQTSTSGDTGPAGQDGILGKNFIANITGYPQSEATMAQRGQMNERSRDNTKALPFVEQFSDIQQFMKDGKPKDWDKQITNILEEQLSDLIEQYGFQIQVDSGSFNSINPGRNDGQMNYHATSQLHAKARNLLDKNDEIIEVVPSGNGGHMFSVLMAREMTGIKGPTIITTNENDMFQKILGEGRFKKPSDNEESIHNPSVSMIIDFPNNMWRLFSYAFGPERANEIANIFMSGKEVVLTKDELQVLNVDLNLHCYKITPTGELDTIYHTFKEHGRLICPHTANAYFGLQCFRDPGMYDDILGTKSPGPEYKDTKALISETASPWKFLAATAAGLEDIMAISNSNDTHGVPVKTRLDFYNEYREDEKTVEGCQKLLDIIKEAYKREGYTFDESMIPENLRKIYAEGFEEPEAKTVETFHTDSIAFVKEYAPEFRKQVETLLEAA